MPWRVLFLDIDGVLNCFGDENEIGSTEETAHGTTFIGIDHRLRPVYTSILERVDPIVVLSSAWRTVPELCHHLRRSGIYFHDMTPVFDPNRYSRGHEIQDWLNACVQEPRYAILDDDDDMLPHQLPNFFRTSSRTGITKAVAAKVIAHLTMPISDVQRM